MKKTSRASSAGEREGRAAAEARGERAAGDDRGAEAPGVDRVEQAEGAAVGGLRDQLLHQHADRDQEEAVADAGDAEAEHGERQDRGDRGGQQAERRAARSPAGSGGAARRRRAAPAASRSASRSRRRPRAGRSRSGRRRAARRRARARPTLVAPATSITAPEVNTSERTNGSCRTPAQVRGQRRRVLALAARRGDVAAQAGHQHGEAAKVTALSASTSLGLGEEQQRRRRRRGRSAGRSRARRRTGRWRRSSDRGVTTAGSSAQVAGRSSALPEAGEQGQRDQAARRRGRTRGPAKASAPISSAAIAQRSRPCRSISPPSSGPSSIAGARSATSTAVAPHADPELLVREQQQRDVAGAGAERALQVGGEEPARLALGAPHAVEAALFSARRHGGILGPTGNASVMRRSM